MAGEPMLSRNLTSEILTALADTSVVFLNGARQSGKSTLARSLAANGYSARYLTFDDAPVLEAARHDPAGFLAGLTGRVILDEVQRVQDLFLAIKAAVDRDPRPGRFLLTGSTNVMLAPRLSESLAGRMETLTLWPLSQGELAGVKENFLDAIFDNSLPGAASRCTRAELIARMLQGGYPAILKRTSEPRRRAWFGAYINTILQRDVRDMANIEGLTAMPRLLALLAVRAGSLLNTAEVSRSIAMPQTTLSRYMSLLAATFLVELVPAWTSNLGKRLVKAYKLYLNDTGLLAYLLGLNEARLAEQPGLLGPLLENFVVMELRKQAGWSSTRPQIFHFREHTGQEVDLLLEDGAGRIVGIEVKASASVAADDFKGLKALAALAGSRFRRGIVLYTGAEAVAFGSRLHALPVMSTVSAGS
jgi:predicted AAA+ superfamily ATPase